MTITEFLDARIADDEALVERRGEFPHSVHRWDIVGTFSPLCPDCLGVPGAARALAECAAKRAILGEHELAGEFCVTCEREHPCPTLKILAAVYADHPDYEPGWKI